MMDRFKNKIIVLGPNVAGVHRYYEKKSALPKLLRKELNPGHDLLLYAYLESAYAFP